MAQGPVVGPGATDGSEESKPKSEVRVLAAPHPQFDLTPAAVQRDAGEDLLEHVGMSYQEQELETCSRDCEQGPFVTSLSMLYF